MQVNRRKRLLGVAGLAVLGLGGATGGWLYLVNVAPATGPLVVEITSDISENPVLSPGTLSVSGPDSTEAITIGPNVNGSGLAGEPVADLAWSLDEAVSVSYQPGFRDDESLSFDFLGRDLGLNYFDDGESIFLDILFADGDATFIVRTARDQRLAEAARWSVARSNETSFREEQDRLRTQCFEEQLPVEIGDLRSKSEAVFVLVADFESHNDFRFSGPTSALEISIVTGSASGKMMNSVDSFDLAVDGLELPVSPNAIREEVVNVAASLERMGLAILDLDVGGYNAHNADRRSGAEALAGLVEDFESGLEEVAQESTQSSCEQEFPY